MTTPLQTTIVIFGASGDLTRRKLVPALYNLFLKGRMPANFNIVGSSRSKYTHEEFRDRMKSSVQEFTRNSFSEADWKTFAPTLHYLPGSVTSSEDYVELDAFIAKLEAGPAERLYYLSTAPRFFSVIIDHLGAQGMVKEIGEQWRRVIIEKPFGNDLTTARDLNEKVHAVLNEHQIYRIDHFLAKETVQNLLVFRFANTMFEPIWNRNYVDHVQITVAESVDVGHRADYYDHAGVLRDMFQNHLMQLLAMVSMEPPASFDADAVRNEKAKVLAAVRSMTPEQLAAQTIRAQYKGYRDAEGVRDGSTTPTYAALELYIDNWRWQGVPFYLRSGKALQKKATEIIVQFKEPPHMMFPMESDEHIRSNYLALCLQPHEGMHLRFEVKVPDEEIEMRSVDMDFHYENAFGPAAIPEAYETLLLNALEGDATLFTRSDSIEAAWRVVDPILEAWEVDDSAPVAEYTPGSWGPQEADDLLGKHGRPWRHGCQDELE